MARSLAPAFAFAFASCLLPGCYDGSQWDELLAMAGPSSSSSSSSSTGTDADSDSDSLTTTSASGGTTAGGTEGSTGASGSEGGSTGLPLIPTVDNVSIVPDPLTYSGSQLVQVHAHDSEGVRMEYGTDQVQGKTTIELTEIEPGIFEGLLKVYTGFDSGNHEVTITPWKSNGNEEGEPVIAAYSIDLQQPGSGGLWEISKALTGPGQVQAIAVLQNGDIIEFITLFDDDTTHCMLRRRESGGSWGNSDLIDVVPGIECRAIDIEISDDGTLGLLMDRSFAGEWTWSLLKMSSWGAETKSAGSGNPGEVAYALAEFDGSLAVCGSTPTGKADLTDAMVRVFPPGLSGQMQTFDSEAKGSNMFTETARGCAFIGDKGSEILVVGDTFGPHVDWKFDRNRRFDLIYRLSDNSGDLHVTDPGPGLQSVAVDVDVDEESGRAIVLGYICEKNCVPEGQLWLLEDGEQVWQTSIGPHPVKQLRPFAVRWSPARYFVVASGDLEGAGAAFLIRAYAPFESEPLWTFSRETPGLLNLALTLTIGAYGEVYAGGYAANAFPVFAIIYG